MSNEFESALMKARKLAALASAGVGGERENAVRMLEAHLTRHGLTMAALSDESRITRSLACVLDPKKPTRDMDLRALGTQTLCFVLGKRPKHIKHTTFEIDTTKLFPGKRTRFYMIEAELTELEHEDWQACFKHYAPSFVATRTKLRRAVKMALSGFIHQHDIFPPDDSETESKPLTRAQIEALISAMKQSGGDKWDRPAGRLEQGGFMLE